MFPEKISSLILSPTGKIVERFSKIIILWGVNVWYWEKFLVFWLFWLSGYLFCIIFANGSNKKTPLPLPDFNSQTRNLRWSRCNSVFFQSLCIKYFPSSTSRLDHIPVWTSHFRKGGKIPLTFSLSVLRGFLQYLTQCSEETAGIWRRMAADKKLPSALFAKPQNMLRVICFI